MTRTAIDKVAGAALSFKDRPESRACAFRAIREMRKLDMPWTYRTLHAAIYSHNHPLLRWLVHECAPTVTERDQFPKYGEMWPETTACAAIRSRNRAAIRHVFLMEDHFLEVAQEDDTRFLGVMLSAKRDMDDLVSQSFTCPQQIKLRTDAFESMLENQHDQGRDGFWWLLKNGLVDVRGDRIKNLIVERYGERAHRYIK